MRETMSTTPPAANSFDSVVWSATWMSTTLPCQAGYLMRKVSNARSLYLTPYFIFIKKKRKQKNEEIISNHLNLVKLVSSNEKFHACIA